MQGDPDAVRKCKNAARGTALYLRGSLVTSVRESEAELAQ